MLILSLSVFLPKYARVNLLLTTTSEVIKLLQKEKIGQVQYDRASISFEEFLDRVRRIRKNAFLIDYHFPEILVFNSKQSLYDTSVYKNGFVVISDKASSFPVKMLSPPPGCVALDACAAPGMKTSYMASLMNNKGTILASDWKPDRIKVLEKMLASTGVVCCHVTCVNFLDIDPFQEPYKSVEYALVDPSCSGSGMVARLMDIVQENNDKFKESRIEALVKFQVMALKHAMSFPNVKRIAYSTCSVNVSENENVVEKAMSYFPEQYEVVDTFPEWPTRGDESFQFGYKCVRAISQKHLTNGFFVAILERNEDIPLRMILPSTEFKKGQRQKWSSKIEAETSEEDTRNYMEISLDEDFDSDDESIRDTPVKEESLEDGFEGKKIPEKNAKKEKLSVEIQDEFDEVKKHIGGVNLSVRKLETLGLNVVEEDSNTSLSSTELEAKILSKTKNFDFSFLHSLRVKSPISQKFKDIKKRTKRLTKVKRKVSKFVVTKM